ncbi:MAG TPA: ATP-binding protein [Dehalococcoidales bacterium]|nr:ATP-binding protein [Dehalococcoidales bacterium]
MENRKKLNLLMVEDSEIDAYFNVRTLEKAGFEIVSGLVTSAQEMKAALARANYDLVIADHNLPQFDSFSALELYKTNHLDIPFIVVSGTIGEEMAVELMKKGAHDYVMKNNLSRLAPVVERELRDAEIRRERRKADAKLKISEERFRQVAEVAGEMIWEADAGMKYLYVNPVALELTGYSPEELVGQRFIYDLFPEEVRQGYRAALSEYFESRQPIKNFTSTRVRKDGRMIILETSAAPVVDAWGKLLGYRGIDNNITEQTHMAAEISELYQKEKSQRQKLQEEAEVKNLFINVLAHELKNPLSAIMASSEILQENTGVDSTVKVKLASNILNSSRILSSRLEELLDLARYSKGTVVLKRQNTNMTDYLHQVAGRFMPALLPRRQSLKLDISADTGSSFIDESRMEQVIINLLSNSSKYSPENSEITMKAGRNEQGIYFEVIDYGIGIAPEEQSLLFQPYYRVIKNRDISGVGLGLGLAISNKIVEAHGGTFKVQSQPGRGSTFRVELPG